MSLSLAGVWWQGSISVSAMKDYRMDRYIHLENLALFRRRLADAKTTAAEREVILKLLADEEAREPSPTPKKI